MARLKFDEEYLEQISKQIYENFLADHRYRFLGELEYSVMSLEDMIEKTEENIRSEIKYYRQDVSAFIELLLERKLTDSERRICLVYMQSYKFNTPLFYTISSNRGKCRPLFPDLKSYCTPVMYYDEPNLNAREYCTNSIFPTTFPFIKKEGYNSSRDDFSIIRPYRTMTVEDFVKGLPPHYLFSVKNEPESLQPYKDIIYPWDDNLNNSKEIHRKEINKVTGDSNYGFYTKSGRHNRKRSKMVQE